MADALTTRSDWLAAHPPAPERLEQTFALCGDDRSRTQVIERPVPTGDPRHDAYLGALAEHIAAVYDLSRPAWSVEPGRFLDRFWFVSEVPRHGVFLPERSLHRV